MKRFLLLISTIALFLTGCSKEDDIIPVTSVTLNKNTIELVRGKSFTLTATVLPKNATKNNILWFVEHGDVVTVSQNGVVTAKDITGTATVVATSADGKCTATCKVNVIDKQRVRIFADAEKSIVLNNTDTLKVTTEPAGVALTFSSDATDIATVDERGIIRAKSKGEAVITITSEETPDYKMGIALCKVTVTDKKIPQIEVSRKKTVTIGKTENLEASAVPSGLKLNYVSENENVVSVDGEGFITANSIGDARITVTTVETSEYAATSAYCDVTVVEKQIPTISVDPFKSITIGRTDFIKAKADPDSLVITYSSDKEDVVSVDSETGEITALAIGEAQITVTTTETEDYASNSTSCKITVIDKKAPKLQVGDAVTLTVGKTGQIVASVEPATLPLKYSCEDRTVIILDEETGEFTAFKPGTTTVTVTVEETEDYRKTSAVCTVTVEDKKEPVITVNPEFMLSIGESMPLGAVVEPDGIELVYASSNTNVAISSDGTILAVREGSSTITVTSKETDEYKAVSATSKVIVVPTGAIPAKFSVSATKQVYFSKGNLVATYNGSEYSSWSFADNQYDRIGSNPGNTEINKQDPNAKVDLFGWSTTANNRGISTSDKKADFSGDFVDWGTEMGGGWYTLTADEWRYILSNGDRAYDWVSLSTADRSGLLIYPDGFKEEDKVSGTINSIPDRCVFLPVSGIRSIINVDEFTSNGYYWTSTKTGDSAEYVKFGAPTTEQPKAAEVTASDYIHYGKAVRLVKEVK